MQTNAGEPKAGLDPLAQCLADLLLTGTGKIAAHELALAETALVDLVPFMSDALKGRLSERLLPLEAAPDALLGALL